MKVNNFKATPSNLNLQNIKKDLDDKSKDKAKDKEKKMPWKNWENWVNSTYDSVKLLKNDEIKSLLIK
jgi:hypothetical protein